MVRLSLPPLSSSLMCFSASLISSPPLCFSYTPSQFHKGMRGRRANKPVVVQRGRSGAGQRRGDGGRRGNDVESEAVVPLEPNQDSPVCVLITWMTMWLCGCMHVFSAFYDRVFCVFAWAPVCLCFIQFMCVCVCVQTQLWLALQLITRYSQLLITQHLFCPRSTLFCACYQPGSLRRIRL